TEYSFARRWLSISALVQHMLNTITDFYPYGVSTGDSVNPNVDDGGSPSVPIATSFAFFERTYQALFVNNNGVISFEVAVPEYTSQAFPLSNGRAFIAPFWADVDNRHKGQVLYRETTHADLLQKATEDVRSYFADFQDFAATWVFIATWDRVTYYGGSSVTPENTFQALLITNGTSSFAMFNYGDVSWTTGTASGGASGVGGTPAQAGFNSGGSTHYFNIPGSRTADIINVEMTSNINYPGRWIFRTDAFSVAGGCYANGKMLKYGDVYWTDGTCTTRCKCVGGETANGLECRPRPCSDSERCILQDSVHQCAPQETRICTVSGDPHYNTFDRVVHHFQGTCAYTLARTCLERPTELSSFHVIAKSEHRGSSTVSWTKLVQLEVYGFSLIINKGDRSRVLVNEELTSLPFTLLNGRIRASQSGSSVAISTDFGLTVTYDTDHYATITVPGAFKGRLCGVCGNYNDDERDEFTMPNGTVTTSVTEFGNSWVQEAGCDQVILPPPACTEAVLSTYRGESFCGLISNPNGPFAVCGTVLSAFNFLESCVFDMCATGGDRDVLCQSLSAFASACQAHRATIQAWRQQVNCLSAKQCGANSHYEVCTSSCPESCDGQGRRSRCGLPCHEGCRCDEGHVLSGGRCVPPSACGCSHGGSYHALGEPFWEDARCSSRCTCRAVGAVGCEPASCGPSTVCGVRAGEVACLPQEAPAFCQAAGDPHYYTFDGAAFDFMGTCRYTLAKTCAGGGGAVPFNVEVENDDRGSLVVSYTNLVKVDVYGHSIVIGRADYPRVRVDGVLVNLPVTIIPGNLTVQTGSATLVETNFGLRVQYDGHHVATVWLPRDYRGLTCGLCGNYNGNATDDFLLPDGSLAASQNHFGQAWTVRGDGDCQATEPPSEPCPDAERPQYASGAFCGPLVDPEGPFRECHRIVRPEPHFGSCVTDVCALGGRITALCDALSAYAAACQAAGVGVSGWRNSTFCPMSCQSNSHYELCSNTCQRSCSDLAQPTICSRGPCAEGCRCNPGTVWRSGRCVPLAECGCFHGGRNYASGEAFWPEELCRERCECRRDGSVVCEATGGCGVGESCGVLAGARGCHPAGRASCRAWSDPHYVTFDGLAFDFQGACTYTLARNCSRELPRFEVRARNGNLGSSAVSVPRQVTVTVYGQQVDIFAGDGANVQVNGLNRNLPVSHDDGRLSVYRSGSSTVVSTDFGLQVSYNHRYHVTVEVASTFQSKLCGLCGNYNLNATDEFLSPEGRPVADPVQFGISWRVNDGSVCHDGSGTPPVCDPEQRALYGSDGYCGILTSPDGPFAGCHATVSPDSYYNSCVFDLCALGGGADLLAGALEAYTGACQSDGGPVEEWRNDTLGQHSCPLHSHYELCGSACPSSCAQLTGPAGCHRPCGEGCQCDRGYVWSGAECVSVAQCGCDYNGRYLQAGEAVWSDGCSERCECSAGGLVRCSPASCPVGLACSVRAGARGCFQAATARCTVTNDPHYFTFDGAVVHYQGVCAYDVARPCGGSGGEPYPFFRVVMENKRRGTGAVSFISGVHLIVGSAHVLLRGREVLKVNGMRTLLPVVVAEGVALSEEASGFVVARTPHNVTVRYDRLYTAHVEVGAEYAGRLCGMCGNYNGDPRDDLLTPSGEIALDARQFGRSWRAPDVDAGCEDTVDHVEPGRCNEEEMWGHCGVLSDPEGPFRSCHWFVDPALYLESCVYDLCSYEATKVQLCRALEAYAQACGLAGVPLVDWRGPSGCHFIPASDPCSAISCGEREWCGSNSGIYGCYCDESPQGTHTGQSVDYTLSCEATEMNIALSSCQESTLNGPAGPMRGNDRQTHTYTGHAHTNTNTSTTTGNCSTLVQTNATHIIYTNAVRGVVDPSTHPAITQQKKITIVFGCAYPIENNASSTPVLPTVNNTEITIPTQPGKFLLQMRLYKSDAFTSVHESTVSLGTDEILYVGITLTGGDPARFKQQIRDCWATPTADPNHQVQFIFVTNSCPATQDASVKIIENGVSQFSKLSMKVFKFVGNYNQVHLHCRVAVCDSQSTVC
uniref:Tectorin alpha n=1 Tax=Petromyzon marinus TaxID=7757 RepID=S4RDG9_PETMA